MRIVVRGFLRNPGFTFLCVVSLAAGIGLFAALASIADAILLRPLPVRDAARVVRIFTTSGEQALGMVSYRDFQDFRASARSLRGVVAQTQVLVAVGGDRGEPARMRLGLAVSPDYFDVLGVHAELGGLWPRLGAATTDESRRALSGGEVIQNSRRRNLWPLSVAATTNESRHARRVDSAVSGGEVLENFHGAEWRAAVVVLADAFWRSEYGADRRIIGRRIRVGGAPFTVIGIAPKNFGLERFVHESFYVPIGAYEAGILPNGRALEDRGRRFLNIYARLGDGVSIAQARAEIGVIARRLEAAYPATNRGRGAVVETEFEAQTRNDRTTPRLAILLAAMQALILLIAASNAGGLLLSRAEERSREIAVRMALGATMPRLAANFLIESAMLAGMGAMLGVPLASIAVKLLAREATLPTDFSFAIEPRIDARSLAAAAGACVFAAILCGLAPVFFSWRANSRAGGGRSRKEAGRAGIAEALKNSGTKIARANGRGVLVTMEVALATALVAISAGLIASVRAAVKIAPGYRTDHVLTMAMDPAQTGYTAARTRVFYDQLLDRVRGLEQVDGAALAQSAMLGYTRAEAQVVVEGGGQSDAREPQTVAVNAVTPEYFALMRVPMVEGRAFDDRDKSAGAGGGHERETGAASITGAAIVNQEFERRYRAYATGAAIRVNGRVMRVVGVARDAKYFDVHETARPYVYLPFAQNFASRMVLHVATKGAPARATAAVLGAIRELDAAQPVSEIRPLGDYLEQGSMFGARMGATVAGLVGVCGTLLALGGIYGVIARAAARRRREMAIRVALGARRADVVGLIARQAMGLIAMGAAGGMAIAAAAWKALGAVAQTGGSIGIWGVVSATAVAMVGLCAAMVPAMKGARVDPAESLRE